MAQQADALMIKDSNWLNDIIGVTNDIITKLSQGIFDSVSTMLHNGIAYTLIGIIVMFWLLSILKNGYPTRDDLFEAGKWLFTVAFIMGIFSSYGAYQTFTQWLMIPAQWVRGSISSIFDVNSMNNFGDVVTNAINKLGTFGASLWNAVEEKARDELTWGVKWFSAVIAFIKMFWFAIYALAFFIVLFGVTAMIFVSTFNASLLLCACAIVLPFLMTNPLKPYFFSWLKLFISYSLYAPFALIILSLALTPIDNMQKIINSNLSNQVADNVFAFLFQGTIITICAIYLLIKIPDWIQQIVGASGGAMGALMGKKAMGEMGKSALSGGVGAISSFKEARAGGVGKLMSALQGGLGGVSSAMKSLPGGQTTSKVAEKSLEMAAKYGGNASEKLGGAMAKMTKFFKGGMATP